MKKKPDKRFQIELPERVFWDEIDENIVRMMTESRIKHYDHYFCDEFGNCRASIHFYLDEGE